jgi:hypothetical protein
MNLTRILWIFPTILGSLKIMNPGYVKTYKLKENTKMIKHIMLSGCGMWAMTKRMKSSLKHGGKRHGLIKYQNG